MKQLNEYPTPETDEEIARMKAALGAACMSGEWDAPVSALGVEFAANLERRLAMCRDALMAFAEYHTGDLSEIGGGTRIGMLAKAQVFKDAKQALAATAPK